MGVWGFMAKTGRGHSQPSPGPMQRLKSASCRPWGPGRHGLGLRLCRLCRGPWAALREPTAAAFSGCGFSEEVSSWKARPLGASLRTTSSVWLTVSTSSAFGLGFRVQGVTFRVQGLGFRV